ncbi:hypothetical protein ABZ615_10605 [Streptomyces sp. NPDC007325]|uniref:hypothetical protein n=1 Tax=Streptomyces sp. NPDC007325 TaxID=3154588 RepID=UPI0033F2D2CA
MKTHTRRAVVGRAALAMAALSLSLGTQIGQAPDARADIKQLDSAVIGWDGDRDAVIAHSDGSFDVRDHKNTHVRFGIYNSPAQLRWTNAEGYLPALTTSFERDDSTVTLTNFGDKVTHDGKDYVVVYSRVTVHNHGTEPRTLDPAPSPGLVRLNSAGTTVAPGETAHHDFAIAVDRFGNDYAWPSDSALASLGGYDQHYAHMRDHWNGRLSELAQLDLPDERLVDAYKAGFIYSQIVKDGDTLNVGENEYDQIYDHDLIGQIVTAIGQGELSQAKKYLASIGRLVNDNQPDGRYKHSWPWAVYLLKSGDKDFVRDNFARIKEYAHYIEENRTGPDGIMRLSHGIDSDGLWTVDNESALLGLLAYQYIAGELGDTAEKKWAKRTYASLLDSVSAKLRQTIAAHDLSYIPCAMDRPNSQNRCSATNDANWAASFLFGRWNWDGYLFAGRQDGPLIDLIDETYDHGLGQLRDLPPHTFGGYPGTSTSYNAGYGAAGLRSERYRSEGVHAYQYMITNTQSGPFSWWEGIGSVGTTAWSPGTHATAGTGSGPHMWGQSTATKVLLDSLAAERVNGEVVVGRGVPNEWLRDGETVSVSNFPVRGDRRMGASITADGDTVTLRLSGNARSKVRFDLPVFKDNIASASTGTVRSAEGVVVLRPGTTSVTVKLVKAPVLKAVGGADLDGNCRDNGHRGAVLDGATSGDWKCVTVTGERVSLNVDEACTYDYPHHAGVFARSESADPYSWSCYVA